MFINYKCENEKYFLITGNKKINTNLLGLYLKLNTTEINKLKSLYNGKSHLDGSLFFTNKTDADNFVKYINKIK